MNNTHMDLERGLFLEQCREAFYWPCMRHVSYGNRLLILGYDVLHGINFLQTGVFSYFFLFVFI